jgi:alkylation response protein AidB-like acyl-CoA dehydrogenase
MRSAVQGIVGLETDAWEEGGSDFWRRMMLTSFSSHIAGGTDEIQKNIIGDRVLGLPREPMVDKDLPFKDLRVGTQRS